MINQKRAQNQYISWILIFSMVIGLSYVLYNWSIDQATQRVEEIEDRTDPIVCNEVGLSIDGVCQDFRSLKLNLTNSNNVEITGFVVRTVGLYSDEDNYLESNTITNNIKSGSSKKLTILTKGTVSQLTIVPIAKRNNKNIICEERSVAKNDLKQC